MRNLTYKFIPNYRGHLITWETGVSPSPAPGQPGVGGGVASPTAATSCLFPAFLRRMRRWS